MPDALKSIILRDAEVRAVQAGRATVRWAVKGEKSPDPGYVWAECLCDEIDPADTPCITCDCRFGECPLGAVGERRRVREAFATVDDDWRRCDPEPGDRVLYRASDPTNNPEFPWSPAITMPRWASRLTVQIVAVRVEEGADGWEWVVEMKKAEVSNG